MAIMKAREGFHGSSIKDLESSLAFARYADALSYYDYLNSYAVELGEAGRNDEARNVARVVLASPIIHAYPEWQQTANELTEPSRSFITVPEIEVKHAKAKEPAIEPSRPATILPFTKLKEAPPPEKPERITPIELSQMSAGEKREMIMNALRSGAIHESEYDKMMFMFGLMKGGPASNVLDLEDETILNDLIIVWAHLIEPEELAAVISALRDCKDDLRRTNIMDNIIRKAFEYSRTCGLTEEDWRLKVECRLPEK